MKKQGEQPKEGIVIMLTENQVEKLITELVKPSKQ